VDWAAQHGSMVDRGSVEKRAQWCLAGARALGFASAHPRRWRGGEGSPAAEEDRRWLEPIARAKEGTRELGSEGERGGEGWGARGFI
jgi:hypothetical protein